MWNTANWDNNTDLPPAEVKKIKGKSITKGETELQVESQDKSDMKYGDAKQQSLSLVFNMKEIAWKLIFFLLFIEKFWVIATIAYERPRGRESKCYGISCSLENVWIVFCVLNLNRVRFITMEDDIQADVSWSQMLFYGFCWILMFVNETKCWELWAFEQSFSTGFHQESKEQSLLLITIINQYSTNHSTKEKSNNTFCKLSHYALFTQWDFPSKPPSNSKAQSIH